MRIVARAGLVGCFGILAVASAITACVVEDGGGCDKDSDCKGDRVCTDGQCVGDGSGASGSGASGAGASGAGNNTGEGGSGGSVDCSFCDEIAFNCDPAGECTDPLFPECFDGAGVLCGCLDPQCTDEEFLATYLACYNDEPGAVIIYCYGKYPDDCSGAAEVCGG